MGSQGERCKGLRSSCGTADPGLSTIPQDCFLSMTVSWYQSLIKVLLSRFPQSCRHFQSPDLGTQYLVSPLTLLRKGRLSRNPHQRVTGVPSRSASLTKQALLWRGLDGMGLQIHIKPCEP